MDLKTSFDRCTIVFEGKECALPHLLRENIDFIMNSLDSENGRTISLHITTPLIQIATFITFGLYCMACSNRSPEDVITSLPKDTYIIYQDGRAIFRGIADNGHAVIERAGSKRNGPIISTVPPSNFHLIRPYYGDALSLDKRGVRGSLSEVRQYFAELFQINETQVPIEVINSVVIVTERSVADRIMESTYIKLPSGRAKALGELFPSAYYSEGGSYSYSGNIAKVEPILKFTGRSSIARELIVEDFDNRILGMIVCEKAFARIAETELNSLLTRRSLKHICILEKIENVIDTIFLDQHLEFALFAWSNRLLLENSELNENVTPGSLSDKLVQSIKSRCRKHTSVKLLGAPIQCEKYYSIKRSLWHIAKYDYSNSEKELFVIIGFSLLNLFVYAIVSMQQLEHQISQGVISMRSPLEQIKKLEHISSEFTGTLSDDMTVVVQGLREFYMALQYENHRDAYLFDALMESTAGDQISVIMPKERYGRMYISRFGPKNKTFAQRIHFYTPIHFLKLEDIQDVICCGALKTHEMARCVNQTGSSIVLLYEFELPIFRRMERQTRMLQAYYDDRTPHVFKNMEFSVEDNGLPDADPYDGALEDFVGTASLNRVVQHLPTENMSTQSTVGIMRIIVFETGETAFLTKNYVAYCFDEFAETVIEKNVEELQIGDHLVFSNHSHETADIVDDLLQRIIDREGADGELATAYSYSIRWKQCLKQYMSRHNKSYREVSKSMAEMGHIKHEVTIRSWLNDESHIVGPRDIDSFIAIALIAEDEQMTKEPERYWDACNYIRAMRVRILKYLGVVTMNVLSRKHKKGDRLLAEAIGDVTKRIQVLKVDRILTPKGLSVPTYISNRPQSVVEEG